MAEAAKNPDGTVKRAPTLYIIIAMKLLKGVIFISLALALYTLSDNDLPAEYRHALDWLKRWAHVNPERRFWTDMAGQVGKLTEMRMLHVALGTLIYSLFAIVEGVGLMFRISWAGWLSIGESAFFIPIEIYELSHNFTWLVLGILIVNVFMVWYLFQNRDRLFRHHH